MKIVYDLVYLNKDKPKELPDTIVLDGNDVPRKGDTVEFDLGDEYFEPFVVEEVRYHYFKTDNGHVFDKVYIFLKII